MKYYMDLAQNFGNSSKENRRIFGVNTGPNDYLPPKPAIKTLLDTSQIVNKIKNEPNKMRINIEICKEAGLPFLKEDSLFAHHYRSYKNGIYHFYLVYQIYQVRA